MNGPSFIASLSTFPITIRAMKETRAARMSTMAGISTREPMMGKLQFDNMMSNFYSTLATSILGISTCLVNMLH